MKQGLGDKVEKITKATGIKKLFDKSGKDCGCESRKQKLNNITFKRTPPSGCLTEQLYNKWTDFKSRDPKTLDIDDQQLICDIIREVWSMSFTPCSTCSSSVWAERIKKINSVYSAYEEEGKKSKPKTTTTRGRKRQQPKKTDGIYKELGKPAAVRNGNDAADTPESGGAVDTK